ncbi:MAG TPA: hypothetical protein VFC07_13945 [Verrucomicrobiae bacterium]|nr:hypothetical protein [Verrucomicrobiae bacterium]
MKQSLICVLLGLSFAAHAQTHESKPVVDIGSRIEMFVDNRLIDSQRNVSLQLQTPVRREVVLVTDKPWEGVSSAYFTVIQDKSVVRLYYRGSVPGRDNSPRQSTCYAESADGIHFNRPNLGICEFQGSKQNNIIYMGAEAHNFAPFIDRNPHAIPAERFKALGGGEGKLFAFASPDGLHWHKLQSEAVLTKGTFDSLNVSFWDENANCYRCYSRYFAGGGYNGPRAIQSSSSTDFRHWTDPVPNRYRAADGSEPPLEHFYTSATLPCPGAPGTYLSFPKRFVPDRKKFSDYPDPGVSDAMFMSSRDGAVWDRTFPEAWLRPGPDPHNWTQRSNMPAWGIVQLDPAEFSLYVSEHYQWPDNRLRRLTVRRHGFASVHAGAAGGEFSTRPLVFSGKHLILNCATSAAGSVQVEIQDENGNALPGFSLAAMNTFFGDELDAVASWKSGNDLSALIGKPVRFHFVLKDADLFALRTGAVE